MDVTIIFCDINGKWDVATYHDKDEVYSFCVYMAETGDDSEIKIIDLNDTIIYTSLTDNRVTWDDLVGFFA